MKNRRLSAEETAPNIAVSAISDGELKQKAVHRQPRFALGGRVSGEALLELRAVSIKKLYSHREDLKMIHQNLTQFPSRFVSYPTNRLIAHFKSQEEVKSLLPALAKMGVDLGSVYILDGQEGVEALDPGGEARGVLGQLSRTLRQGISLTEQQKIEKLVGHLSTAVRQSRYTQKMKACAEI